MQWRSYKQEQGFHNSSAVGSGYTGGREYNMSEAEYRKMEYTKQQIFEGRDLMKL